MNDKKKELAAIAGVLALVSGESEVYFAPRLPANHPTPWQAWGRQQTMQYRDITQRRIIKRNR
ncbi:MAG: hypothetical protein R6T89_00115 [Candidatus Syntrophosphaera sp.]